MFQDLLHKLLIIIGFRVAAPTTDPVTVRPIDDISSDNFIRFNFLYFH